MFWNLKKFNELFPTKWSCSIFIAYILLFVNQGILVKASQVEGNGYDYNVITVVVWTELIKLMICIGGYLKDNSTKQLISELKSSIRLGFLYLIPALLYCFYNNLSFINLANYDPTTYFILMQFRTVVTGFVFQLLFRKRLTNLQWFSLCILSVACIVKEMGHAAQHQQQQPQLQPQQNGNDNSQWIMVNIVKGLFSRNILLILLQIFCSCFAGVYSEYLLKDPNADGKGFAVNILIQNIFMYFDSILCNIVLLLFILEPSVAIESLLDVSCVQKPYLLLLMVNGAIAGITTSFFLKNLNSIVKTFAATLEILVSAIVCNVLFKTPIDFYTFISIILVFAAIYIYVIKPVQNTTTATTNHHRKDSGDSAVDGSNEKLILDQKKTDSYLQLTDHDDDDADGIRIDIKK